MDLYVLKRNLPVLLILLLCIVPPAISCNEDFDELSDPTPNGVISYRQQAIPAIPLPKVTCDNKLQALDDSSIYPHTSSPSRSFYYHHEASPERASPFCQHPLS
jgi:hypothetical protein